MDPQTHHASYASYVSYAAYAVCGLAALSFTAACLAQGQTVSPGKLPAAEQMLQVPVGQTHIPREKTPPQVANPYEGNSDALAQGRALFHSMNCVGCHAPQGGGGIGPPLSDKVWIYGSEPGQIYLTITQGRPNGMPAFGNALPPDSIWKLAAYVRSLSKSPGEPVYEPAPAQQSGKP